MYVSIAGGEFRQNAGCLQGSGHAAKEIEHVPTSKGG